MKRSLIMGLIISTLFILIGCQSSANINNNQNTKEGKENYLGGEGSFHTFCRERGMNNIYDDKYIYGTIDSMEGLVAVPIDGNGEIVSVCKDATCSHIDNDCIANVLTHRYIEIDGKLYIVINDKTEAYIIDSHTQKKVFTNKVPNELKDNEAAEIGIDSVNIINSEYIIISSSYYAYIVDRNFNIITTLLDKGILDYVAANGSKIIYCNDLHKLVELNLETGDKKEIESVEWIANLIVNEEYIYYADDKYRFHKYNISNHEDKIIAEKTLGGYIGSDYIYYTQSGMRADRLLHVIDKDGNAILESDIFEGGDKYSNIVIVKDNVYIFLSDYVLMADKKLENQKIIPCME